ncbi:AMP-binding protein [Erythrobacter arachoides]|uniref:AMP-binding protein n=1 Tax=Aurantiacibacter arachoides TaxID=1850444 RepID=A0A844ZZY0_9SPHN|nr:long-chain fatty acid--CoA ligase [Aurantiacibacter arachoides]MXO92820.1 AMP-binding protein [Aurantiacibacter arachoides]GGD54233.1 dicarboxylate--CoA ligase PimA [Aurantiacibacter arachoides]
MIAETAASHPIDTSRILAADGSLRPRLLTELLDRAVSKFPARICIDFLGREWTYGEVGKLVDRVAAGLQACGLAKGDRFGLCLPNTPYSVILYFAVLRAGGTVVNINPLYTEDELAFLVVDSGAKWVAVPDLELLHAKVAAAWGQGALEGIVLCPMADVLSFLKSVGLRTLKRSALAKKRAGIAYIAYRDLAAHAAPPVELGQTPDDVAVLQYTGGTTGRPKGAMLTHANLAANAAQMLLHLGEERDVPERSLGVLPLFHVFALTCVLNFGIETAAELVLLPRFEMDEVLKTIKRKPPTQMFGVPTIYNALGSLPDDKVPDLSTVRTSISGGAPLPLEVRQQYEKRTGSPVAEGYGLTEASPIVTSNPLLGRTPVKDNSAGPAFPHTVVELRDEEGNLVTGIGPDHRGEICVRGPQVMKGYWNRPEETEKTFFGKSLRTGDIGYLDKDGYLFIVDRIKDLILCSGYNVYPRAIEDAAYEHPAVKEAVAIGVPDPYRGEAPKLFIALHEGEELDAGTLDAFLRMRLNKIEMPDSYEFRAELPKTLVGKLEKKALVAEERARREATAAGGAGA